MEQIKYSTTKDNSKVNFHLISCEIEHTGEALVSKYFEPAIVKKDELRSDVSFRGRPMNGKQIKLDNNDYLLANLKSSLKNENEYLVNEIANEFHYWNYDQVTDLDDSTNQAVNWLNISKCLNSNVTMKDLDEFDK